MVCSKKSPGIACPWHRHPTTFLERTAADDMAHEHEHDVKHPEALLKSKGEIWAVHMLEVLNMDPDSGSGGNQATTSLTTVTMP